MSSRHGRAKQYGPEPPAGVYTKPPPPVHGNNTYSGRPHHQQHHHQQQQQQFYGVQQPNPAAGARPPSSSHNHHSLPRNAWSADRHSPVAGGSSSNSSNERAYAANRRAKHHRVYNSHRQTARAMQPMGGGGGATTDPDALSSVTTAGVMYNAAALQQPHHHQSQHQLHHLQQHHRSQMAASAGWPPDPLPPAGGHHHHQQQQQQQQTLASANALYLPSLPPQNAVAAVRQPPPANISVSRHPQQTAPALPLLLPSCDVAVDACGGHCPRFENFCHFCLLVFYFSGMTVGFLLIMAAIVTTRDPRFLYIGGLVLPVSAFLMAVQCRVRQDADRRKRHRQLNGRHHINRSNAAATNGNNPGQSATGSAVAAETIPLQNIMVAGGGGGDTLRRQFQGNVYQYVGQSESNYTAGTANGHHYETAPDQKQIEGVPWWRREDNRPYHGRAPHL